MSPVMGAFFEGCVEQPFDDLFIIQGAQMQLFKLSNTVHRQGMMWQTAVSVPLVKFVQMSVWARLTQ